MWAGQEARPFIQAIVSGTSLTYKGNEREFRLNYRNVEAASTLAVEPPPAPSGADLGNAPHSGCALPLRLARPYSSLSFSPQSLSICF